MALQDMWLTLLSQSGTFYCREQKWEAAITCYRELLSGDCYREDIYRQLMRCYALCGRMADIQQTYNTCADCLRRDLQLTPSSDTSTLYQQLVQQSLSPGEIERNLRGN